MNIQSIVDKEVQFGGDNRQAKQTSFICLSIQPNLDIFFTNM